MSLPCGNCIGCRLEYSRQWAIRCVHEAQLHEQNTFITLTYNPESLPFDGSLNKKHFQDFMKRLRKNSHSKIRYYHCGEYGEKLGRPHYHACLFGYEFTDLQFYKETPTGEKLYTSPFLEKTWGKGYCVIGELTFQSAAYVARYIMKKINGKNADDHYTTYDDADNPWVMQKEYTTMSRKPGIASGFYDLYKKQIFFRDSVTFKGREMKPPRYYSQRYEIDQPEHLEIIKANRISEMKRHAHDNTAARLKQRETVKSAQIAQLPRPLEEL